MRSVKIASIKTDKDGVMMAMLCGPFSFSSSTVATVVVVDVVAGVVFADVLF